MHDTPQARSRGDARPRGRAARAGAGAGRAERAAGNAVNWRNARGLHAAAFDVRPEARPRRARAPRRAPLSARSRGSAAAQRQGRVTLIANEQEVVGLFPCPKSGSSHGALLVSPQAPGPPSPAIPCGGGRGEHRGGGRAARCSHEERPPSLGLIHVHI